MPYETEFVIIILQNLYFKSIPFNAQNLFSIFYNTNIHFHFQSLKPLYQSHIYNFSMTLFNIHQFTFIFLDQKHEVFLSHLF